MGTLHSIVLLDEPCAEWLRNEGFPCPEPSSTARLPTPAEVRETLFELPGFTANLSAGAASGGWSALIESSNPASPVWTDLRFSGYSSDDQPCDFYFSKGHVEAIFAVVERLTRYGGPLVVVDDGVCCPVVVSAGDLIPELLRRYHTA